ncbi:hypothetical protein PLESTB_000761300 [Pleodorina starrii]|uniref:Uncharacterized protein n=1 Tax=Pleodorina starrii TaxID=330485 RepID=A0A9W6F246_9CHLO|nr:hypothetical protein PLESTM_001577200 [Pleodorina starrii]GLC53547.1 hypothetical protein PLESTB_000761300 [Pleodorina starrii]GLC65754.1 hypothetical protein PLESTF_000336500 [Pleodorina starrii]
MPLQKRCALLKRRRPVPALSRDNLRSIGRLTALRSLYLDAAPPAGGEVLLGELRSLAALTALILGPVYGRNCCLLPGVMPVLGQLQAALLTCRIHPAGLLRCQSAGLLELG